MSTSRSKCGHWGSTIGESGDKSKKVLRNETLGSLAAISYVGSSDIVVLDPTRDLLFPRYS